MKINAIPLRASARATAIAALIFAMPVMAQESVIDPEPTVEDVAKTPLTTLNLARDPIPPVLLQARAAPYANQGISGCDDIRREVADLEAVLGDDFDTTPPEERAVSAGGVAQSLLGSLIPFRGVIRELSGAKAHEHNFREAISAGLMRRAYLKGIGQQLGCPYPASPAPAALISRLEAAQAAEESAREAAEAAGNEGESAPRVSNPVVQSTS